MQNTTGSYVPITFEEIVMIMIMIKIDDDKVDPKRTATNPSVFKLLIETGR